MPFVSCRVPLRPDAFMHFIRDQSSGAARSVGAAPGRQLPCLVKGRFNKRGHVCHVHTAGPVFICSSPHHILIFCSYLSWNPARDTGYYQRASRHHIQFRSYTSLAGFERIPVTAAALLLCLHVHAGSATLRRQRNHGNLLG